MNPRFLVIAVLLSLGLVACQPAVARETPPAKAAPQFSLVDQNGQPVRMSDLRGKVVLMDFIYTSCTDACPALQAVMENVRRDLGEAFPGQVNLVTITFDPEYDTPRVMKRYASGAGWDLPGWHFLSGSQKDVEQVNAAYGSVYQRAEEGDHGDGRAFLHNTQIILIDQQGMLRQRYLGPDLGTSQKILEDARALLR